MAGHHETSGGGYRQYREPGMVTEGSTGADIVLREVMFEQSASLRMAHEATSAHKAERLVCVEQDPRYRIRAAQQPLMDAFARTTMMPDGKSSSGDVPTFTLMAPSELPDDFAERLANLQVNPRVKAQFHAITQSPEEFDALIVEIDELVNNLCEKGSEKSMADRERIHLQWAQFVLHLENQPPLEHIWKYEIAKKHVLQFLPFLVRFPWLL